MYNIIPTYEDPRESLSPFLLHIAIVGGRISHHHHFSSSSNVLNFKGDVPTSSSTPSPFPVITHYHRFSNSSERCVGFSCL